jgi:putative aminopeptidase FrvX
VQFNINSIRSIVTCAAALAVISLPAVATQGAAPAEAIQRVFSRLVETPAVSGDEAALRDVIAEALPKWAKPRVDQIGNLIVTLGSGTPHVLLATNIDEDGFIVSRVGDDGYLRLARFTSGIQHRLFEQYHYSQPVVIRTGAGRLVPGVVASISQHLGAPQVLARSIRTIDDLWVDTGSSGRAETLPLGIQVLDAVSLRDRRQPLAHGRTAGIATQGRANAYALVELLARREKAPEINGTLTVAWTAQGVYRGRGLARLGREIEPDRVMLLDRVALSSDQTPTGSVGQLGGGPLVRKGDAEAEAAASRAGVKIQVAALPAANLPWPAAKVSALALPVVFAQTPVEVVDPRDVHSLVRLIEEYVGLTATPAPAAESIPSAAGASASGKPSSPVAEPALFTMLPALIEAHGVSPNEAEVADVIRRWLPSWARPVADEKGNLTVSFGHGGASLVFVAHIDEVGYQIASLREDGTAAVRRRGGVMDAIYEARPVAVHTARGTVQAVMAPRFNYAKATEAFPAAGDVFVYFGTDSLAETEALGIAVGDTLTVPKRLTRLAGQRATGRSMDDRVGDAALISALWRIDPARVANRVTFAWVVGEEIGLAGSAFLASRVPADYAFAVDTSPSSDSPVDSPRLAYLKLGAGAVVIRGIDASSMAPKALVSGLEALARSRGIPAVLGANGGGTDAASFVPLGAATVGLSWPGRYSHSPVEVVDARDVEALVRMIVAVAEAFPGATIRR